MKGRVHVIGAGLAGLSAAVRLSKAGASVTVHETAKYAGGRCRTFHDQALQSTIDNGTHLLLSGNHEVLDFLHLTGGHSQLVEAERGGLDFLDLASGERWCVDLGTGKGTLSLLKWLFDKSRQPPGLKPLGFLKDVFALKHGRGKTVAACVNTTSELYHKFWQPMTLAVLNAAPQDAAAELIWAVLRETVIKGGAFAKPMYATHGLGTALVDPALKVLAEGGADVHFQRRITALDIEQGRVYCVSFAKAAEVLSVDDAVILAVPHHSVANLVADVKAPTGSRAILNVHYQVRKAVDHPRMTGLVGGQAEWLFQRSNIASVTISGADAWMDKDTDSIAHAVWPEIAKALGEGAEVPAYRVIKERRATFAATPQELHKRPGPQTLCENLYLAGDWTDTGLPATLEGAVKSGRLAAQAVLQSWS
ncbi:MAG: FAD-dependent oxidoreductase [Magnetovibrio sp.]|nr:FAD-dependent oxidoreductase [Magnetovibrio sp.]